MYHGYLVVLSTFANRFSSVGLFYSYGLYLSSFESTFDISKGYAALLPALVGGVSYLAVVVMGRLQDKLTLMRYSVGWTYALSGLLMLGGSIGGGRSAAYGHLLGCSLITGFGIGLPAWGSAGVLVQWFARRKGAALSVGLSGAGIGVLIFSLAVNALLESFGGGGGGGGDDEGGCDEEGGGDDPPVGGGGACGGGDAWRRTMLCAGVFSSCVVLVSSPSMRLPGRNEVEEYEDVRDRMRDVREEEEERGEAARDESGDDANAGGGSMRSVVNGGSIHSRVVDGSVHSRVVVERRMERTGGSATKDVVDDCDETKTGGYVSLTLKETFLSKTFFCICFWAFFASIPYDTVFLLIPLSASEGGLSEDDGALALSLTGILGLLGSLTIGFAADSVGYLRALQISMVACMLCTAAWPFCLSRWSLCLVTSVYSYFAAAFPLHVAVLSKPYAAASRHVLMTAFGLVQTMNAPGTVLGPYVAGVLVDTTGYFHPAAFFLAGSYLLGNGALFFVPSPQRQVELIEERYGTEMLRKYTDRFDEFDDDDDDSEDVEEEEQEQEEEGGEDPFQEEYSTEQ